MSYIKETPIQWKVQRLMCGCGGEFEHKLNVKYANEPFLHACNQCGEQANKEHVYPRTVWGETE
jgi:hypothetical protein